MEMPMVSTHSSTTPHPKPPLGKLPEEEGGEGVSLGGAEGVVEGGVGGDQWDFPSRD